MGAWGLEVAEAGSARELGARAVPAERAVLRQRARWLRLPPEGLGLRVRADLRLGACCFGKQPCPALRKTALLLECESLRQSPAKGLGGKGRPRRHPGAPAPGSGPEPRAGGNPRCPLGALWPTCPGVPPGYTRPAASLPYQGVCRWLRQPAEWTRRSVRWTTDSALAHHTPSVSSQKETCCQIQSLRVRIAS